MTDEPSTIATHAFIETADENDRLVLENWAFGAAETELFSEDSFAGILHETGVWNEDLYWRLDKALFAIGEKYRAGARPNILIRALFDLFVYIHGKLAWHRMPSDLSSISGFSDEDCQEWADRVQFAFKAAITGVAVKNEHFDRANPLM